PTQLLQISRAIRRFDLFELSHAAHRAHDLDPAIVRSGGDSIHFIKRVVAVLLVPKISRIRIETQTKAVAHAVRKELFDVRIRLCGKHRENVCKRVVEGSAAVVIQTQNETGKMIVVGLWAAEL